MLQHIRNEEVGISLKHHGGVWGGSEFGMALVKSA
jgi:hypothetical protein